MNFTVYDKKFVAVGLADIYESVIWTERYYEPGDFEIYTLATSDLVELFKEDYFIRCSESEYIMMIEHVEISTDVENGDKLIIKGRSVESILDRRIVINNMKFDSTDENPVMAWEAIHQILLDNVISPEDASRKFSFGSGASDYAIVFDTSNLIGVDVDKRITDITINASYYGCTVLEAIYAICESSEFSFKFNFKYENGKPRLYFHIFKGLDLTTEEENIYSKVVRFGPFFDNLLTSDYVLKMDEYKNVAIVGGKSSDEEEQIRQTVLGRIYDTDSEIWAIPSGFNRRETYVDASNVSDKTEDGQGNVTEEEYRKRLDNEGYLALQDLDFTEEFSAEVDPNFNWTYGNKPTDDYYIGDTVIIENNYGISANALITEVIRSEDSSGKSIIPTFELKSFSSIDEEIIYTENSDTEPGKGSGKIQ